MFYMLAMIAFVSVLAFNFTDSAKLYIKDMQAVKKVRGRDFSLNQIQRMLSTTKSLSESALFTPQNDALKVCLVGGASGACLENCCKANTSVGFTFKDPTDTAAQIAAKRTLSGPADSPVYYRADGTICETAANGDLAACAYALTSSYKAQCPGGVAECDHAEHLEINISLKATSIFAPIRDREFTTFYFPNVNYQPAVPAIPAQTVKLGQFQNIPITGDSGHPSEVQNFKFSKCDSGNPSTIKAVCQDFANGVSQVSLEGLAVGTTTVTLEINDGGIEHFLSKPYTFNVEVIP